MCLSSVYKKEDEEHVFLYKNIAKVELTGDGLYFTDLFGVRNRFDGTLLEIDLLENTIFVKDGDAK